MGSNPVEVLTFSGFSTQLPKFAFITAMVVAYLISKSAVQYMKHFIYHFAIIIIVQQIKSSQIKSSQMWLLMRGESQSTQEKTLRTE